MDRDTIFAVASAPGPAVRGLVRVSGPQAFAVIGALLGGPLAQVRAAVETRLPLPVGDVPVLILTMPGPGSFTGEDVVELHLPGSPLLLELLCSTLRTHMRDAAPGEFTRRAHEGGRIQLGDVIGLLHLIHAANEDERRRAAGWLQGGLLATISNARSSVQDALALLESGLDFTSDETGAVPRELWAGSIVATAAALSDLVEALPMAHAGGEILLLGPACAGKSSLANQLVGQDMVLVDPGRGTTRDLLRVQIGEDLVLLDAPGDDDMDDEVIRAALELRDRVGQRVTHRLWVVDPRTRPSVPAGPLLAVVGTHGDQFATRAQAEQALADATRTLDQGVPRFLVSNQSGAGLGQLMEFLRRHGTSGPRPALQPVRDLLCQAHAALQGALKAPAEELTAEDLRLCLGLLDQIHGSSTPEDLLDRIFASFCLGK